MTILKNHNAKPDGVSSNPDASQNNQIAKQIKNAADSGRQRHAAWGAFQAGMQILQKYAERSAANSETIAKSNLQLLHRALLRDPEYSQTLQKALEKKTSNSLPTSHCVFVSQELRADFLTLQSGTFIQLKPHQERLSMYLAITGKPLLQSADRPAPTTQHWWNRYGQIEGVKALKNGDAIFVSNYWATEKRITAEKKECILLRIQLPFVHIQHA